MRKLAASIALLAGLTSGPNAVWAQTDGAKALDDGAKGMPFHLVRPSSSLAETAPELDWIAKDQKPRVIMLCIHGLGLHKGNYDAFGREMSKYGIGVIAIDMRGFGDYLESGRHKTLDFNGSLADIEKRLKQIHIDYPGVPVVIAGESMGGAIALRTAALYPELVSALISSVPSGDRFNELGQGLKVGVHAIFGGFNKPMNIGETMVKQATVKEDLRSTWSKDPEGKMMISPNELLKFHSFMDDNKEAAKTIADTPVLFIQGVADHLVRPAGTWQLYDNLATPNRQLVMSKNGEHLILETAQFSKEDSLYIRRWINKNVIPLDAIAITAPGETPTTVSTTTSTTTTVTSPTTIAGVPVITTTVPIQTTTSVTTSTSTTSTTGNTTNAGTTVANAPSDTITGLNYWIELLRNGKTYRCNNKMEFKSGDSIRFHVIPQSGGYAYVLMKSGSTGKKAVLFPSQETGMSNYVPSGQDYSLPSKTWLTFDNNPGTERISLVFSTTKVAAGPQMADRVLTAYVSPHMEGSKDLVPTRMQLTWDDPTPVIIPDDFSPSHSASSQSMVRLRSFGTTGVLSVDVALEHR